MHSQQKSSSRSPAVGFHETFGKYFDGEQWSVSWKTDGEPLASAVAIFACGKEVVVAGVLNGDLQGKGFLKLEVPKAEPKRKPKSGKAATVYWTGDIGGLKIQGQ